MGGQSPDQSEVGIQAEKTPEQLKQELVDTVLDQDRQLEGQLVTDVSFDGQEKVYIFNAFPGRGSGG